MLYVLVMLLGTSVDLLSTMILSVIGAWNPSVPADRGTPVSPAPFDM